MDVELARENRGNSATEYTVQLNFEGDDGSNLPSKPPFLNSNAHVEDGRHKHRHRTAQDAVPVKLASSHFRPCLPNENPILSTCTPRQNWRPCFPPITLASGKESRTFDRHGSTWAPGPRVPSRSRSEELCTFDRRWVLQAAARDLEPDSIRRAGKLSDYGGSLIFPGARIHRRKFVPQPHGKNVGDLFPSLRSRSGDVFILPCINSGFLMSDRRGYVGFVHNSDTVRFEGGTLLLRVFKFRDSALRTRRQLKLFLVTIDGRWRLKGVLDSRGYLEDPCVVSNYRTVPVRHRRALQPNTSDLLCVPQRGDLIIREPWKDLFPCKHDRNGCLLWWRPNLELHLNDILVRACVWNCCGKFEGFVDLYYYNGKGIRWVFLGRDETIFNPITLGADSDSSDGEKKPRNLACYANSIPHANPCAGNWPLSDSSTTLNCNFSECGRSASCR